MPNLTKSDREERGKTTSAATVPACAHPWPWNAGKMPHFSIVFHATAAAALGSANFVER